MAKTLYSLLFGWLNEYINQKLCRDDFAMFIGLFDLPGPQNLSSRPSTLDQFCINFANKWLQHFLLRRLFESHIAKYNTEDISRFVPSIPYFYNSECMRKPGGLIHIMDDQTRTQEDGPHHGRSLPKEVGQPLLFQIRQHGQERLSLPSTTLTARSPTLPNCSSSAIWMPSIPILFRC